MNKIVILGIFVADAAFLARRLPQMGETLKGSGFALGPGGKGSNQAVAAARLGSPVAFISRLGNDEFGKMAEEMWQHEKISAYVPRDPDSFTGAAFIFVDETSKENAIIVVPGAAGRITARDIADNHQVISQGRLFMTQLETPMAASRAGLEIAKAAGVPTILNPAPATDLDSSMLELCDFLTPNESEAAILTGHPVNNIEDARSAAAELRQRGAGTVIVTLGENGAVIDDGKTSSLVDAFNSGPVVETTGAGDSFCGAFAHALAIGHEPLPAARFACAAASISVTRAGTAPSMPTAEEVSLVLAG